MRGFEVEFNDRADNAEKRLIALLAVLFAFGMLTACGSDDSSSSSSSEASSSSSEASSSSETEEEVDSGPETKAAFIMVAPIGDAGWNYAHDVGRQYAEEMTGVETAYVDAVPEEQLISVITFGISLTRATT